jgi:hypothetical protein
MDEWIHRVVIDSGAALSHEQDEALTHTIGRDL